MGKRSKKNRNRYILMETKKTRNKRKQNLVLEKEQKRKIYPY